MKIASSTLLIFVSLQTAALAADGKLPAGFSYLKSTAPNIKQDIRYATTYNFTGIVVRGYKKPECIVTNEVAKALRDAEQTLQAQGYELAVYDCYRPLKSVNWFIQWTKSSGMSELKASFFPHVDKSELIRKGYIATSSSHSRGSAVDVGLMIYGGSYASSDENDGVCDDEFRHRPHDTDVDMGTTFDCFSEKSATDSNITDRAKLNRKVLSEAMNASGFIGYKREWWHFKLRKERFPNEIFDFDVE